MAISCTGLQCSLWNCILLVIESGDVMINQCSNACNVSCMIMVLGGAFHTRHNVYVHLYSVHVCLWLAGSQSFVCLFKSCVCVCYPIMAFRLRYWKCWCLLHSLKVNTHQLLQDLSATQCTYHSITPWNPLSFINMCMCVQLPDSWCCIQVHPTNQPTVNIL